MKDKVIYCLQCEVEGKKRSDRGVYPVKDVITGDEILMCSSCYNKWKQLQELKEFNNGDL